MNSERSRPNLALKKPWPLWLSSCWLATALGCASLGSGGGGGVGEIHLFGVPVAVNIDGRSGVNGLGVNIYASAPGGAKGIPLVRGRLDILMFDNTSSDLDPRTAKPIKVWNFDAAELPPFATRSLLGDGYQLALPWGPSRPKGKAVIVVARYHRPNATDLYSAPNTVSLSNR